MWTGTGVGGGRVFSEAPMRSERMSRVCIVVLEEVEDDEPSPLHSKTAQDRVSQHSPPEVDAQEEKVRMRLKGERSARFLSMNLKGLLAVRVGDVLEKREGIITALPFLVLLLFANNNPI